MFSIIDKKEPDVDLSQTIISSRGLPTDESNIVITSRTIDTSLSSSTLMGQITGIQTTTSILATKNPIPELGVDTPHTDELRVLLNRINDWGLDTFRIEDLSGQRPLTTITYRIFQERFLLRTYAIEPHTLISYLLTLEDHYQQVPYHNKAHGADVCQSMHVLLNASALDVREKKIERIKKVIFFLLFNNKIGRVHRIGDHVGDIRIGSARCRSSRCNKSIFN